MPTNDKTAPPIDEKNKLEDKKPPNQTENGSNIKQEIDKVAPPENNKNQLDEKISPHQTEIVGRSPNLAGNAKIEEEVKEEDNSQKKIDKTAHPESNENQLDDKKSPNETKIAPEK